MMRDESEIYAELNAAQTLDRELKLGTPEYEANRQKIGAMIEELSRVQSLRPAAFTEADYQAYPDSWEQSAVNRKRRVA